MKYLFTLIALAITANNLNAQTTGGCGTPTDITSTAGSTTATIYWTAVPGATSYTVGYHVCAGCTTFTDATTTADSLVLTGLTTGTTYYFDVKTICTGTSSGYSSIDSFTTTSSGGCGVPTDIAATAGSTTTTIYWTAVPGATSYIVAYHESGSTTFTDATTTADSLVLTGLTTGITYVFDVKTICAGSSSGYSTIDSFTTAPGGCGVPTDITFTAGPTTATIYWMAVPGAASYIVGYHESGSTTFTAATTTADSLVLTGLITGITYVFDVGTLCINSSTSYSPTDSFITIGGPLVTHMPSTTNGLYIYPNPVTTEINITSPNPITNIAITNLLGQTMYTHEYNPGQSPGQIDVADLPADVYFVKINGPDSYQEVREFVKQ